MADLESAATVSVTRLTPSGAAAGERTLAAETPVAISFCGIGYAVMMSTPADLEDFAFGFALSERLIGTPADIVGIQIAPAETGLLLDVELVHARRPLVFDRVRHRVGESSCGLCGIENLDLALRPLPRLSAPPPVTSQAIFAALAALGDRQPINAATGAVHAAAFCAADGTILAAREDVGRHNALDKLIGHGLRGGLEPTSGFVLLSARCSYELVEKAALWGVPLLVTVSAPTGLAVRRAEEAKLTLIALARPDAMLVMTDPYGLFG